MSTQPMSDPFASIAKPIPQGDPFSSIAKPANTSIDTHPLAQPGNAFTSKQGFVPTIRANYDDAVRPSNSTDAHPMLHDLGRGFAETLLGPVVHPLDTIKGIGHSIAHLKPGDPENPVNEMVGSTVQDFQDNGAAKAIPHLAGQAGGAFLGGEMGGEVAGLAGKVAKPIGAAMERGGLGVVNHALDATQR